MNALEAVEFVVNDQTYNRIWTDTRYNKLVLLGLGGSYAYGTNKEGSDIDVRGIATYYARDILLGKSFNQVEFREVDTVIYSMKKMIGLLAGCNPNTIEILGLRPEHYIYISPLGQTILDNKQMFLSKLAFNTFGGYANQQLRRLENKAASKANQSQREKYILNSIINASHDFKNKYLGYDKDSIKLLIDTAIHDDFDTEIFIDINLSKYPLRDLNGMLSEMQSIVRGYETMGKRNKNAIMHDKIEKHMCHLVRLYLMAFDIFEKKEINTYRENDFDLFNRIYAGEFLDENDHPTEEFKEMIDQYEKRLKYADQNTDLPDKPDYDAINELLISANLDVIEGK